MTINRTVQRLPCPRLSLGQFPLIVTATLLLLSCGAPAETTTGGITALDGDFERDKLIIENQDGTKHSFQIYVASTFDQQRRGLMFVRDMPDNFGMLFIYEEKGVHSMWMKNTYISLDMVFARADGAVSSVIHDTVPLSLKSQGSIEPVNYVLELNGGTARRFGINSKSRLLWAGFE